MIFLDLLTIITNILKNINGIDFIYLNKEDVIRHRLVKDIIQAYDNHEIKKNFSFIERYFKINLISGHRRESVGSPIEKFVLH